MSSIAGLEDFNQHGAGDVLEVIISSLSRFEFVTSWFSPLFDFGG